MTMPTPRGPRIVTFYSYKGGVGRTMALVNTAVVLASAGHRVLVVDWDLEAPGLNEYLGKVAPEADIDRQKGVIDLCQRYLAAATGPAEVEAGWYQEFAAIEDYVTPLPIPFPAGRSGPGSLALMTAGDRSDEAAFARRVRLFRWDRFFEVYDGAGFLGVVRQNMKKGFDYVLVDARTGTSDIASLSVLRLPDAVVNCFTPSRQGVNGARRLADSIERARPGIPVFPVPMRVDRTAAGRAEAARSEIRELFDGDLRARRIADPAAYWRDVEVPYDPFFSFEEVLAALHDPPSGRYTVLSAAEGLVRHLTGGAVRRMQALYPPDQASLLGRTLRAARPSFSTVVISACGGDRPWSSWLRLVLETAGFAVVDHDPAAADPAGEGWATAEGAAGILVVDSDRFRDAERTPHGEAVLLLGARRSNPDGRGSLMELAVRPRVHGASTGWFAGLDISAVWDEEEAERLVLELVGPPVAGGSPSARPPRPVDAPKYPGPWDLRLPGASADQEAGVDPNGDWIRGEAPDAAAPRLENIMQRARETHDRFTEATAAIALARIALAGENHRAATGYARDALRASREGPRPLRPARRDALEAEANLLLGRALWHLPDGSREAEAALRLAITGSDRRWNAEAYAELAEIQAATAVEATDDQVASTALGLAMDFFANAEYFYDRLDDQVGVVRTYRRRAEAAERNDELGLAERLLRDGLREARSGGASWQSVAEFHSELGRLGMRRANKHVDAAHQRIRRVAWRDCLDALTVIPDDVALTEAASNVAWPVCFRLSLLASDLNKPRAVVNRYLDGASENYRRTRLAPSDRAAVMLRQAWESRRARIGPVPRLQAVRGGPTRAHLALVDTATYAFLSFAIRFELDRRERRAAGDRLFDYQPEWDFLASLPSDVSVEEIVRVLARNRLGRELELLSAAENALLGATAAATDAAAADAADTDAGVVADSQIDRRGPTSDANPLGIETPDADADAGADLVVGRPGTGVADPTTDEPPPKRDDPDRSGGGVTDPAGGDPPAH
jgi:hypothetical protein